MQLTLKSLLMKSDRWFYIDDGPLFETLPHVIDHYSRCADGLPVLLKMALPSDGNPPIDIHKIPIPPVRKRVLLTPAVSSPVLNTSSGRSIPGRNPLQRTGSAVIFFFIIIFFNFYGAKENNNNLKQLSNWKMSFNITQSFFCCTIYSFNSSKSLGRIGLSNA